MIFPLIHLQQQWEDIQAEDLPLADCCDEAVLTASGCVALAKQASLSALHDQPEVPYGAAAPPKNLRNSPQRSNSCHLQYVHTHVSLCVCGDCGRLSLQSFSANYGETDKVSIL